MIKLTKLLTLCIGLWCIAPPLCLGKNTAPPWVAVDLVVFEQQQKPRVNTHTRPIDLQSLPEPYQSLTLNAKHNQLPLFHQESLEKLKKQLTNAGFHVLYASSWQQPSNQSAAKATPHYLIEPYLQHALITTPTITMTDLNLDDHFAESASPAANLQHMAFEETIIVPSNQHTNIAPNPIADQVMPYDATQSKLRDSMPELFSSPSDTIEARYNPAIKGHIQLKFRPYYHAALQLYYQSNPDEPPTQFWHITQQLSTHKPNYLDHDQLGAVLQIKTIPSPTASPSIEKDDQ